MKLGKCARRFFLLIAGACALQPIRVSGFALDATAEIVIATNAPKTVSFAAEELRRILKRALDKDISVVSRLDGRDPSRGRKPDAAEGRARPFRCSLVLGDNLWARAAGIDVSKLPRDGFRIVSDAASRCVYIAGRDDPDADLAALLAKGGRHNLNTEHATLFGVYEFLERVVGARFYFPGDLGTCVPRAEKFDVPFLDVRSAPVWIARHYYANGDGAWPAECDLDYGGKGSGKDLSWMRLRMQTKRICACHGQNSFGYTKRFHETHPEYLQMRKDGTRATEVMPLTIPRNWYYGHWCHTSPIWDVFYEDVVKRFKAGEKYVDITPHDGLQRCWCENCQKAYSKEHPDTWATELMWGNFVKLANRLIADKIDGYVLTSAYGAFSRIPDFDIPTNVIVDCSETGPWVKAVPEIREHDDAHYRAWHKKTGAKNLFWHYPAKWSGFNLPDVPQSTPRAVAEYYQPIVPISIGGFYESDSDRALYNYLNYYVFSKVAWNGTVDVDALLKEHHRLMFGAAAEPMAEFFESVEERWIYGIAGRPDSVGFNSLGPIILGPSKLELWAKIYSPKLIAKWKGCFAEAAKRVAPASLEARRIAFLKGIFLDPLVKAGEAYVKTFSVKRELAARRNPRGVVLPLDGGDFTTKGEWNFAAPNGRAEIDSAQGVIAPGALHLVSTDHSPTGGFLRAYATYRFQGDRALKPGSTYRLSFFMKTKDVRTTSFACGTDVAIHYAGEDHSHTTPAICGTTGWVHQEYVFTVPADAKPDARYLIRPRLIHSSGEAWFDDFRLEEISK